MNATNHQTRRGARIVLSGDVSSPCREATVSSTARSSAGRLAHRSTVHLFQAMRSALLDFDNQWGECGCHVHRHREERRAAEVVDYELEVVVVPVADVDRAKNFYKALG